uniref:NADH dehydrogenase subunit 6 n=1 Tax=Pthirus pubis TaxID=121228 RepID=K7S8I3_PTHPU|nr:NADH dehydrogenase subunit 6 [Pthirus pubis]
MVKVLYLLSLVCLVYMSLTKSLVIMLLDMAFMGVIIKVLLSLYVTSNWPWLLLLLGVVGGLIVVISVILVVMPGPSALHWSVDKGSTVTFVLVLILAVAISYLDELDSFFSLTYSTCRLNMLSNSSFLYPEGVLVLLIGLLLMLPVMEVLLSFYGRSAIHYWE